MELFEKKDRTDNKPMNHIDNLYDFYDRSCFFSSSQIRDILNEWFERYPNSEKHELKTRFKFSFSSTFYELFLHELFLMQGFVLEPHPDVVGSTKKPDFLVTGNGIEFYLEAKESTDKTDADKSIDRRINSLYDNINKVCSPNFFIRISDLILKSSKQTSSKKLIRFLELEISKCDPDIIFQYIQERGLDGSDPITYEDEDLKLIISLIPKSLDIRGDESIRPIGIYPIISTWGSSDNSIKSSIKKKATRYGLLDKPYLICINSTSDKFTDDTVVKSALFGSLQLVFLSNSTKREQRWERALDGVFKNSIGPQLTRVSSVLITNVHTGNLHIAKHWLVKHPFAKNNIDINCFELSKIVVENNQIKEVDGKTIQEILEIPDDWMRK